MGSTYTRVEPNLFGEYEILSNHPSHIFGLVTIGSSALILKIKRRAIEGKYSKANAVPQNVVCNSR